MVTLTHYLILSAILFAIGTAGVFVRRNLITISPVDRDHAERGEPDLCRLRARAGAADGQIIVFFVMTVAAAEAAVGLADRHSASSGIGVAQPRFVREPEMVITDVGTQSPQRPPRKRKG